MVTRPHRGEIDQNREVKVAEIEKQISIGLHLLYRRALVETRVKPVMKSEACTRRDEQVIGRMDERMDSRPNEISKTWKSGSA